MNKRGYRSCARKLLPQEWEVLCLSKDYIVFRGTWKEAKEVLVDLMERDVKVSLVKVVA